MSDKKINIKIDILNLMHLYSCIRDFIDIADKETETSKSFNFALLKDAFTELETEINKNYIEEHGDYCADKYDELKAQYKTDE